MDTLTIYKGYILVSDSGTLGRVTYALSQHDGHVATNNLIRIVVDDVIADIPIPVPKDRALVEKIGDSVIESIDQLENSINLGNSARDLLQASFE